MAELIGVIAIEGVEVVDFLHFSRGGHFSWIGLIGGPSAANLPGAPSSDKEVHSDDEIFREIKDYTMEAERENQVQVGNPLYMCSHWTSGGRKESVHLGALGLQLMEPRPWTLTRNISARNGYLVFPTRSWVLFLVSMGWGI